MTTPTTRQWPGLFFDKGGAVINVKHPDFGAKGDGQTDDYEAIRKAMIAAAAASKLHGVPNLPAQKSYPTIVFPAGNYLLKKSLDLAAEEQPYTIPYLRVVGLGNANLIKGSPFSGTAAWRNPDPFQLSFEGLSFLGFPTGLELGESTYNVATATVQLVRTNFFGCTTGLRYGSRSSLLSLDYCKFNDNTKHIDILRCDLIYLNRCYFQKFNPVASTDTAIHVATGRLHIYGGYFTPGPVTTAQNAWIGIYGNVGSEGAHIGLIAHGVRAGGESGGMTFVNYNAAPDTTFPGNAKTRIIIRDSQMEPGQGNNGRPECVVRLWQTPNQIEITGCHWTNARPVDWAAGLAAMVVHTDDTNSPLVYRVENNCDNGDPTPPSPHLPTRTRHYMPTEFEGKANLLGGIRRGTATVPGNANSVTVDLGLPTDATIRAKDISVTPLSSLGNVSSWWVGAIAADHFVIRTNVNPGEQGVNFAWSVDLRRY
jgi:hypothetical protein